MAWCSPCTFLGTKPDDESLWIALGLHLGVLIIAEHTCICGAVVDVFGSHGLSCKHSGGRIPRHVAINETVRRALGCTRCFGACGCIS